MKKRKLFSLFLMLCILVFVTVPVFADPDSVDSVNPDTTISQDSGEFQVDDGGEVENMLERMFSKDLYQGQGNGLEAAIAMSTPFVYVIYTLSLALVIIISYFFVGVTMIDLAYIIIPPLRPLLDRRTAAKGGPTSSSTGNVSNFGCISDSCYEAVHGGSSGGGGMGYGGSGGGDRGVGSALTKYISSRIKEFAVFCFFLLFFISGLLGRLVVVFFRLFSSLLSGLGNFY